VFDVSGAVALVEAVLLVELPEPLPEQEIRIIRLKLLTTKVINFMFLITLKITKNYTLL
jgi:hypothetical protein